MNSQHFQDSTVGKALTAATKSVEIFCIVTCLIYLFCLMGVSQEDLMELWTAEEIRLLSVSASIITITFVAISSFSYDNGLSLACWCGGFCGIILSVGVILYNAELISLLGNLDSTRFIFHFAFLIAILKAGQFIGILIVDTSHEIEESN